MLKKVIITSLLYSSIAKADFPNVCDVVETSSFEQELDISIRNAWCPSPWPLPPYPCAHVSYYVPKYFIEVVSRSGETMFSDLFGVSWQLRYMDRWTPYGVDNDAGSYSYHAHVIQVPLVEYAFSGLPCGGGLPNLFCFSAASEHLGMNWRTGKADLKQPHFLAWAANPKACLEKGKIISARGQWGLTGGGIEPMCSNSWMGRATWYPPTDAPVCTGWGIHFPRTGTVTSSDQTTASLLVASRIKSIGGDVFRSVASSLSEKWQMIYPQVSRSFKEGQNIGWLRTRNVNEIGRLGGKFSKYLYVVWEKTNCTVNRLRSSISRVWIKGLKQACKRLN